MGVNKRCEVKRANRRTFTGFKLLPTEIHVPHGLILSGFLVLIFSRNDHHGRRCNAFKVHCGHAMTAFVALNPAGLHINVQEWRLHFTTQLLYIQLTRLFVDAAVVIIWRHGCGYKLPGVDERSKAVGAAIGVAVLVDKFVDALRGKACCLGAQTLADVRACWFKRANVAGGGFDLLGAEGNSRNNLAVALHHHAVVALLDKPFLQHIVAFPHQINDLRVL